MNGSMIPLAISPTPEALQKAIASAFAEFLQVAPTFELKAVATQDLTMFVSGSDADAWCWVQVFRWPDDSRDELAREYMCSVDSRGSRLFCALVAYGVCVAYDSVLIDEGGFLAAGRNLSARTMRRLLEAQLDD